MKRNLESGMSLIFVMILIALISIGLAAVLKNTEAFRQISASESVRKQLTLDALSLIQRAQEELRRDVQIAFTCHSNLGQCPDPERFPPDSIDPNRPETWDNTWVNQPIIFAEDRIQTENGSVSVLCQQANPLAPEFCQWRRTAFPKIFRIRATTNDPGKGIIVQYTATVEISPNSIRDIAYMITQETADAVTFADGTYTGRVGVRFQGPLAERRINFSHADSLNFEQVFSTNLRADQLNFTFAGRPNLVPRPQFRKGVATDRTGNEASGFHSSFLNLANGPNVIRPDTGRPEVRPPGTVLEQVMITYQDDCSVRMEYRPFVRDFEACRAATRDGFPDPAEGLLVLVPLFCGDFEGPNTGLFGNTFIQRFEPNSPNRVFFEGQIPEGSVFHAPTSERSITPHHFFGGPTTVAATFVENSNAGRGAADICGAQGRPAPNYTIIGETDIHLRTSLIKGQGASEVAGNIALVSLNGRQGIVIDRTTESLLPNGKTFGDIIRDGEPIRSTEIAFRTDAALVALVAASQPGGPSAPFFANDLVNNNGNRRLGTFEANAGLIGGRFSPSRQVDADNGQVVSGFDRVNLNFNRGALTSPPPGFNETMTAEIGSAITSLSLSVENAEEAIAAMRSAR